MERHTLPIAVGWFRRAHLFTQKGERVDYFYPGKPAPDRPPLHQYVFRQIFLPGILLLAFNSIGFSQAQYSNVKFSPQKPNAGQTVKVAYVPPQSKVMIGTITCLAYLTGPPPGINARGFPIVREVKLTPHDGLWEGEIHALPEALGMVVAFADSLGSIDNYEGGGYLISFFTNGEMTTGTLAARGELYTLAGSSRKYINQNKPLARKLYEEDFLQHPEAKRIFIRGYLGTFDLLIPADTLPFRIELERYAHYPDLTENDLRSIWWLYSGNNRPREAKALEDQAFRRFPNGAWALTQSSLLPGLQLANTKDDKKRLQIYNQYKKQYDHPYEDESTNDQMSDRKGDLLSYLVEIYAKGDSLSAWEKEMASMDYSSKCHTFQRTANQLLAGDKSDGIVNGEASSKRSKPKSEHPFFMFFVMNDDFKPALAEKLSRQAVELYRANLNAPRRIPEALFLTDKQIGDWRDVILGSYLDQVGQSLLRQNKFEEAYAVFTEAINKNKYSDQQINEHFIEILVKTNRFPEAIEESRKMMEAGKSTTLIDACYQRLSHKSSTIATERKAALEAAKEKVKEQLVDLKAPGFEFVDLDGKPVSFNTFKNKTVVLDFWALWCAPCIRSLGPMAHVAQTYGRDNGIVFLFVNVKGDAHERAAEFLHQKGRDLSFVIDRTNKAIVDYGGNGIPTRVVIDRHGKVRFRTTGVLFEMSDQEQENELIAVLELVK